MPKKCQIKKKKKKDIDECLKDNGGCDINANCTNTQGGFNCTCNIGYSGDGLTCNPSKNEKSNQAIGIGVGVGVGILALFLLVLLLVFFLKRKNVYFLLLLLFKVFIFF